MYNIVSVHLWTVHWVYLLCLLYMQPLLRNPVASERRGWGGSRQEFLGQVISLQRFTPSLSMKEPRHVLVIDFSLSIGKDCLSLCISSVLSGFFFLNLLLYWASAQTCCLVFCLRNYILYFDDYASFMLCWKQTLFLKRMQWLFWNIFFFCLSRTYKVWHIPLSGCIGERLWILALIPQVYSIMKHAHNESLLLLDDKGLCTSLIIYWHNIIVICEKKMTNRGVFPI